MLAETLGDDAQLGVGLLDGDAGFAPCANEKKVALVGAVEIGLLGQEEVGFGLAGETRTHHADHRKGLGVKPDGAADHAWIAAETPFPKAVGEHGDARTAGAILFNREGAAHHWSNTQHAEVSLRDMDALDLLGVAGATEIHPRPHKIVYRGRLKQGGFPDGGKFRDRHGGAVAGLEFAGDIDQAIGVVIR